MLKILAIVLVCAILIGYLKCINSEFYSLALVGSGILILYTGLNYLTATLEFFKKISEYSSINDDFLSILFKIVAVGYVVEFGAGVVEDMGLKSLADKLVFIGKLLIVSIALPVFYSVLNLVNGLL